MTGLLMIVGALAFLFVLLILGGMLSAALEIRAEKRAGVPVTRPAWEARARRRASGGHRATVRGIVKGLRS